MWGRKFTAVAWSAAGSRAIAIFRVLRLSAEGQAGLLEAFGVDLADEARAHTKKAAVSATTGSSP